MPETTQELETVAAATEASVVADLARLAVTPRVLERGELYAAPDGDRIVALSTEAHDLRPWRKRGTATVRDAASFVAYLDKHAIAEETEVYADPQALALVAVINAGQGDHLTPGWGDHRLTLGLIKTRPWVAWTAQDGKLLGQTEFAEFLEQRLVDVVQPAGADMLELAQTFHATKNAQFESSKRLSSGEVQLTYKEQLDARAGKSGQLEIPETFTLGLIPFEGAKAYRVTARFRYRLHGSELRVGYVLDRPEDVLRAAFDDLVAEVDKGIDAPLFHGVPAPIRSTP